MKILHTSDLHGNYKPLLEITDFDVWVDTGDFAPNVSRGHDIETRWQTDWYQLPRQRLKKKYRSVVGDWYPVQGRQPPFKESISSALIQWLDGRPMLGVPGNHDWVSLAKRLQAAGYTQAWDLTEGPIELGGQRWAGFREIPWVTGEWQGEVGSLFEKGNFQPIVARAMTAHPTVLVTHSPPYGVLDYSPPKGGHCGIPELIKWLAYRDNDVHTHLFGHVHEEGGQTVREKALGIRFSNAANCAQIIEI